jgi:hypothetical protein
VLGGIYTVAAYSGVDVVLGGDPQTAFTALTQVSSTAGIPTSSDVTLVNTDRVFRYWTSGGVAMRMTWNAQAITDLDYVEMVIDGLTPQQLTKLIIEVSNTADSKNTYIHVMRGTIGGTWTDNKFLTVSSLSESPSGSRTFEFALGGNALRDWVIRWIGSNLAGQSISLSGVYATGQYFDGPPPVMTRHGGTFRNSINISAGGLGNRNATTAELASVVHEINTSDYKVEGLQVFNSSTNKPVWATGNADNSTWVDATGAVAHTPV